MGKADGPAGLGGPVEVMADGTGPGIRTRRGLRVALLSHAAAILLLGAATAAAFCYHVLNGGSPAAAASHEWHALSLPRRS